MIVVTGAAGFIGSNMVAALGGIIPPEHLRVAGYMVLFSSLEDSIAATVHAYLGAG